MSTEGIFARRYAAFLVLAGGVANVLSAKSDPGKTDGISTSGETSLSSPPNWRTNAAKDKAERMPSRISESIMDCYGIKGVSIRADKEIVDWLESAKKLWEGAGLGEGRVQPTQQLWGEVMMCIEAAMECPTTNQLTSDILRNFLRDLIELDMTGLPGSFEDPRWGAWDSFDWGAYSVEISDDASKIFQPLMAKLKDFEFDAFLGKCSDCLATPYKTLALQTFRNIEESLKKLSAAVQSAAQKTSIVPTTATSAIPPREVHTKRLLSSLHNETLLLTWLAKHMKYHRLVEYYDPSEFILKMREFHQLLQSLNKMLWELTHKTLPLTTSEKVLLACEHFYYFNARQEETPYVLFTGEDAKSFSSFYRAMVISKGQSLKKLRCANPGTKCSAVKAQHQSQTTRKTTFSGDDSKCTEGARKQISNAIEKKLESATSSRQP